MTSKSKLIEQVDQLKAAIESAPDDIFKKERLCELTKIALDEIIEKQADLKRQEADLHDKFLRTLAEIENIKRRVKRQTEDVETLEAQIVAIQ